VLRDRRRLGGIPALTHAIEVQQPKGVVGVISPWNYPLTLAISDSLPAFVAGNAVVHKPDIQTMFTALLMRAIAVEAGLPEGLWQVVCGDGPGIGGAVVAGADCVSFTGSTAVGRIVAAQAGERLVSASLELGGKNPMLVLDDADLERAAEGAVRACFSTAGQLCVAMERLYVADMVYDEFVARFADRVRAMTVGAAFDYSCDMGSLMSPAQLDKVDAHVTDALSKGAEVVVGGKPRPDLGPWFYEPTLLTGVHAGMRVADEETFGPVVSLYRFATDDEAVDLANETEFGLNASVWSRDSKRAVALAKRLRSGMVNVNEGYSAAWASHDVPIGGMKQSGLGRRHGREGILRYTDPQAIAVQRVMGIAPPGSMKYDTFARILSGSLRAMKRMGRP
jgi:succinate-semialdehyde dehydrogenase/glutarate-semialdehyde dehydrogenase